MSAVGRWSGPLAIGLAVLAAARPLDAQVLPDDSTATPTEIRRPVPTARLVGAGIVTTAASIPAGAFLGAWFGPRSCASEWACEFPVFEGAALGAVLLPAVMVPVVVHLTNRRSGSFLATLGASAVTATAATLIFNALGSDSGNSVSVAAVTAAVASVITEIATTHRATPETPPRP
jgi:hypothetical protein